MQSYPAVGYLLAVMIVILVGYVLIKLVYVAVRSLFQVLLLYGVVLMTTLYGFIANLIQGKGLLQAAQEAGIGIGLIVPTYAYDQLIVTDLGLVAVLIIWLWLVVLVSTFHQTRVGPFKHAMDWFGKWRSFGAILFGTVIWLVFGWGLPNLSAWISSQVAFTWGWYHFLLSIGVGGFVIAVFEAQTRTNILGQLKFNLFQVFKDVRKAVIS